MKELYSNENYIVTINIEYHSEEPDKAIGYVVTNRKTGVEEYETTMLPEAIKVAYIMDRSLKEALEDTDSQIERLASNLITPNTFN